ncbi:NADP-dependent oxidoreductase [Streptomyces sp. NBC_01285]|uniref:NADP-dependent oxidoreductase n=1 Tax=Streptomyces sp. NBC_01285 TaxID=2903813 RepID=UPI002253D440|nr:NADP-dependent oxidoreductase [Streptomyces sp. NBC_01285]MCX4775220.1 NADP-dependent oxidoreductase [Streptomyces sp. NBC_01285]
MKAVRFHSYGDPDVLVHEEADRPRAGAGQVVLKVAGAGVNPVDASLRAGYVREVFKPSMPHVPCYDVAGVVTEVGDGVSDWSVGDAVVGWLPIDGPGAAAEYAVAPAQALTPAPRTVEPADAAALPSVALTAWQALFEHVGLTAGQSIFVNGAGGAVGGYAVQLAAQAGASVTATASAGSRDRVQAYGAERIIDYTATPLPEALAGERFDVVLNLVFLAPPELARLLDLVVDGGAFADTVPPGLTETARGVRILPVFGRSDAAQLADLVAKVDAGDLKIHVARRRPLAELRTVHEELAAQKLPGKTVLIP